MLFSTRLSLSLFLLLVTHSGHIYPQDNGIEKEDPEEIAPSVSSKALSSAHTAQALINKATPESIQKGIQLLELILTHESFKRLDTAKKVPIFLTLAHGYELQKQHKKKDSLLIKLLSQRIYKPYRTQIRLLLTHSYLLQEKLLSAEKELRKLLKTSRKFFTKEEREEISFALDLLSKRYDAKLTRANYFFDNKKHSTALPLYNEVLHAIERYSFPLSSSEQFRHEYRATISYKMAFCLFSDSHFKSAIRLLKNRNPLWFQNTEEMQALYASGTYLLAISYEKLADLESAKTAYEQYLKCGNNLPHFLDACYQLGYMHFMQEEYAQAKILLSQIVSSEHPLHIQAHLLLAHIALYERRYSDVEVLIHSILSQMPKESVLYGEALFVQGTFYLQTNQVDKGIYCLEQARTQHVSPSPPAWYFAATQSLIQSYLLLAQENAVSQPYESVTFLDRVDSCIHELDQHNYTYIPALTRAQAFYIRWLATNHSSLKNNILALADKQKCSPDELASIYLMLLKMSPSFSEKSMYFSCLDEIAPSDTLAYQECVSHIAFAQLGEAHFCYTNKQWLLAQQHLLAGISTIQKLILLNSVLDGAQRQRLFEIASQLVTFYKPEAIAQAKKLISHIPLDGLSTSEKELIAYLRLHTDCNEQDALQFLSEYPSSVQVPHVLHALAQLYIEQHEYEKAQEAILLLQHNFPSYEREDHMLYIMSRCSDILNPDKEIARKYRKELLASYPESPYAAECHFRYFPEEEYQRGTPRAIEHLRKMQKQFLDSPFALGANYYIGLYELQEANKKYGPEATSHYKEAISAFRNIHLVYHELIAQDLLSQDWKTSCSRLTTLACFFRGKALYNHAKTSPAALDQLNEAKEAFETIIQLKSEESALSFLPLESRYYLAKTLDLLGLHDLAHTEFDHLVAMTHEKASLNQLFLQAQIARAKQAIELSHMDIATRYLSQLETCKMLNEYPELYLQILITKSQYYKKMQQFDKAMMYLSKVINHTFASSIRIKAMVLRAEIYDMQKRSDLATRQLEAASKLGGKWGMIARIRLRAKIENKLEKMNGHN